MMDAGDLAAYYASCGLSGSDAMDYAEHGIRPDFDEENEVDNLMDEAPNPREQQNEETGETKEEKHQ